MYDFANSGYTTVVITALFNAYFVAVVANNAPWATLAWTLALSVSYALLMASSPVIGAYADAHAAKKKLLVVATVGCVSATAALSLVGKGDVALAVALIVISNFFYGMGENLIAAFLPELAKNDSLGKVSGWGWSLGYIGGLVSLGATLAYVTWSQGQGHGAAQFVPVSMVITAAIFAAASLPTFLFLRERARPTAVAAGSGALAETFRRLAATARQARRYSDFMQLMLCGMFYQAGIAAVISLAAIYAEQVMKFTTQQTLTLILLVNVTAAIGAFAFGYLQDRIGHKAAVGVTLVGWLLMTLSAYFATTQALFWVSANLAGLCMGSSQSAGRAFVGLLAPASRPAEFYGLWAVATRFSAVFGPLTYGLVTWISGGDHRLAILITGSYFAIGLLFLMRVNVERGREAALAAMN
jgi:MFS transporter, UMF1 family